MQLVYTITCSVHVCINTCVCIYIYTDIYIYIYTCIHAHMHVYIYAYMYTYVCICMHIKAYIYDKARVAMCLPLLFARQKSGFDSIFMHALHIHTPHSIHLHTYVLCWRVPFSSLFAQYKSRNEIFITYYIDHTPYIIIHICSVGVCLSLLSLLNTNLISTQHPCTYIT